MYIKYIDIPSPRALGSEARTSLVVAEEHQGAPFLLAGAQEVALAAGHEAHAAAGHRDQGQVLDLCTGSLLSIMIYMTLYVIYIDSSSKCHRNPIGLQHILSISIMICKVLYYLRGPHRRARGRRVPAPHAAPLPPRNTPTHIIHIILTIRYRKH